MNSACKNWVNSITWQVGFSERSAARHRRDPEFDWAWFERSGTGRLASAKGFARRMLRNVGLRANGPISLEWLHTNAEILWETRSMFGSDLSRMLFDASMILRIVDHRHFYFPRIDFDDLVTINDATPFDDRELPHDYLGVPLRVFNIAVTGNCVVPHLRMISTDVQLRLLNSYRQYLVKRGDADIRPRAGDVVLDCGACIGEISLLFASLVGQGGAVHLFDPIPLHTRFCARQGALNPKLTSALHINALAVGANSHAAGANFSDSSRIDPGDVRFDDFPTTTLDEYVATKELSHVDFVKMDIEGSEIAALNGAEQLICEFKPQLAISGYHKPEDMWEIPFKIRSLDPGYVLEFGHHSPVSWESVFYATTASK